MPSLPRCPGFLCQRSVSSSRTDTEIPPTISTYLLLLAGSGWWSSPGPLQAGRAGEEEERVVEDMVISTC